MNYKHILEYKKGDTSPSISIQILKTSDGLPLDLSGASATFYLVKRGESTLKVNGSAASITDATNGIITYNLNSTDTDTVGEYEAEFKVTFAGGQIASFPPSGSFIIKISSII